MPPSGASLETAHRHSSGWTPEFKRMRLGPPSLPLYSATTTARPRTSFTTTTAPLNPATSLGLPVLPPLEKFTRPHPRASAVAVAVTAELRRKYLDDISMVVQELKAVLMYGPGSACPDAPVSPAVVLKLVRTVQTLEKLRALLLMNPARLRRVSLTQLETVEQQIKMNLLPLATLFRSFDKEQHQQQVQGGGDHVVIKVETDWQNVKEDVKSPRSPSGVTVAPVPRQDWRFLSMVLSLQL
uniref:Uncharacterized protein n=1 Tax=Peronospora matthiolae TaxID=2874970 RepID=A0AAV1URH7_9STRA